VSALVRLAFLLPSQADCAHRERGRVMAGPHRDEPAVGGDVVDPVRAGRDCVPGLEVMAESLHRAAPGLPGPAGPAVRPELLLLLPVDAEHGLARFKARAMPALMLPNCRYRSSCCFPSSTREMPCRL
jgi:hypothetical protein